jgi:Tfp pilus tip-associated adhesin PilY1
LIASTKTEANKLINYIRGDTSNEGAASTYRARGGQLLGDFINSAGVCEEPGEPGL